MGTLTKQILINKRLNANKIVEMHYNNNIISKKLTKNNISYNFSYVFL